MSNRGSETMTVSEKESISKKNAVLFFIDGVLNQIGMCFIEASSIVSVLIYLLTGSASMAGLAQVFLTLGITGGKVVGGAIMGRVRNQVWFGAFTIGISRVFLLFGAIMLFFRLDSMVISITLLVMYFANFFVMGIGVVPWQDLYARTLTNRFKGTVLGYRNAFGGLIGIAGSILIQRLLALESLEINSRYGLILVIGAVVLGSVMLPLALLKDVPRQGGDVPGNIGILKMLKKAPETLRENRQYSKYLVVRILDAVAFTSATFIIIASKERLGLSDAQIGIIVIMQTIGKTAGGFGVGWLSNRLGYKFLIMTRTCILAFLSFGGIALMLFGGIPPAAAYIFAFLTGAAQSAMVGHMLYLMDSVPDRARPTVVSLDAALTLPVAFSTYFAGLMIDFTGYLPYFILISALSIFILIYAARALMSKQKFDQHHQGL